MSLEEIKQGIASLPAHGQREVSAFLFHLRHATDPDYQARVDTRLADCDPAHWFTPEEFERQLGEE